VCTDVASVSAMDTNVITITLVVVAAVLAVVFVVLLVYYR
jgi:hypothetical protein